MPTQIELTDALRTACSVAMNHPHEWGMDESLESIHGCKVVIADEVPAFVVESVSQYDDGDLLVEGYWPDVTTKIELCGAVIVGTMRIQCGGNVSLDQHPAIAALLTKSA